MIEKGKEYLFQLSLTRPVEESTFVSALNSMGFSNVLILPHSTFVGAAAVSRLTNTSRPNSTTPAARPITVVRAAAPIAPAPLPKPMGATFQVPRSVASFATRTPSPVPATKAAPRASSFVLRTSPTAAASPAVGPATDPSAKGPVRRFTPEQIREMLRRKALLDRKKKDAATPATPAGGGGGTSPGGGGGSSESTPSDPGSSDPGGGFQEWNTDDTSSYADAPQEDSYTYEETSAESSAASPTYDEADDGTYENNQPFVDDSDHTYESADEATEDASFSGSGTILFLAVPVTNIQLLNTPFGIWKNPLRMAVSALTPPQVVPRAITFDKNGYYEARFLSSKHSANEVRSELDALGFQPSFGPTMLRKNIRHPGLQGDLSDWTVRALWTRGPSAMPYGGVGNIMFEEVKAL